MEDGLLEKTGKSLAEWKNIVKASGRKKHGEILKFLKSEHGLTHGYANFVSLKYREADAGSHDPEELVDAQYSRGKEHLRPIMERLVEIAQSFGKDVEVHPKMASISLRRKKQFALIQPSTKTRIDLGLKFADKPTGDRLLDSGPFGTMCSHRVILQSPEEVDEQLIGWMQEAYEGAG